MNHPIDEKIYQEFRKALNASNVFGCEKEYVELYNLGYALLDRMEKCVGYINAHTMIPNSEEEFLLLMMYGSMIVDAVKLVLHLLEVEHPYTRDSQTTYSYFADVCEEHNLILPDGKIPTDDKVWEYIRSLSFAHPFETSRAKFLKKGETQYSPAIIPYAESQLWQTNAEPTVDVMIYSTAFPEIKHLNIPYDGIIGYIGSRYQLLSLGTEKIKQIIEEKKQEWAKQKVQVSTNPLDTLKSAASIMESRHEDTRLRELISLLEVQSTIEENQQKIISYQSRLIEAVPEVVKMVESLDTEGLNDYLESLLAVPKPSYAGADYQLQKIFSGLNPYADAKEWMRGLKQAEGLYKDCGSKWVKMDVAKMRDNEIKLLVRIACDMQSQSEK